MSRILRKYLQTIITIIVLVCIIVVCCITNMFLQSIDFHWYFGWKEVNLSDEVSIKVPSNWEQSKQNGLIYFYKSDEKDNLSQNVVFFQSKAEDMLEFGDDFQVGDNKEKNIISNDFKRILSVNGEVNSLSTAYGDAVISVDNIIYSSKYVSFFFNDIYYDFYSWNDNIDDATLEKIADSVTFK